MIYIGNNEISNIYIGTDKIYGIYVGDLQIYPTEIILTAISLENLVWVTNIPASGGTATKENCTYSVIAYYSDGTTVDVTSEATITGSQVIPSTDIEEVHSAGTLTLTASYSGFTATGNVTVYQEAAETSDFSKKPLTFNILSAGAINWTASDTAVTKTIEYKLNNGAWVSITSNTSSSAPTIEVNSGDKIQFRGNNAQYATSSSKYNSFSGSTASFEAKGNIMSLIYGDDFKNNSTISSTYALYSLFRGCTKLASAENLILPATTLLYNCYGYMFYGCTSLTTAPALPVTTLATSCYHSMFRGCASLSTAPALPATTLAAQCYNSMFYGCTSLTTAPELPATTLAINCYSDMFNNCTSLTKAPSVLPATTLKNFCYSYMFQYCTSLTTAPELPATTLVDYCYDSMFFGCKNLNYIKCLATSVSGYNHAHYWVYGVAPTGTFVKNPKMTSWGTGDSGIPSGWIVEDNQEPLTFNILSAGTINWTASDSSAKTIEYKLNNGSWVSITSNAGSSAPTITVNSGDKIQFRGNNAQYSTSPSSFNSFRGSASFEVEGNIMSLIYGDDFKNKLTISSAYTFNGLFRNCANLVSAENLILPATTLTDMCYYKMFDGCTSLTTAPALPATTLAYGCYDSMFGNCTSLTAAPSILPAITLAENCYANMFYGCSSLETAPELPANTLVDGCYQVMFADCSSLNYIKCLATDISAYGCTDVWVYGVAPTGTFVKNPDMNDWTINDWEEDGPGIPAGWDIVDA